MSVNNYHGYFAYNFGDSSQGAPLSILGGAWRDQLRRRRLHGAEGQAGTSSLHAVLDDLGRWA